MLPGFGAEAVYLSACELQELHWAQAQQSLGIGVGCEDQQERQKICHRRCASGLAVKMEARGRHDQESILMASLTTTLFVQKLLREPAGSQDVAGRKGP